MQQITNLNFSASIFLLAFYHAAMGSDHFDGPSVSADPTIDITDMYVFPNPTEPKRLVLVMNVHPNCGMSAWFSDALEYRFRVRPVSIAGTREKAGFTVDENEIVFSCSFDNLTNDGQKATQSGRCRTPLGMTKLTVNKATSSGEFDKTGIRVFSGVRLDPFFMDVPGIIRSFEKGKLDFHGFDFPRVNCLSIILEIDSKRYLPDEEGMYGVVSEVRTRGKKPVVLDTFGRPEITNVILADPSFDKINRDLEVRDIFNRFDPFGEAGPYKGTFQARFDANLHRMDALDGKVDWPLKDGRHPLTDLHIADFTVIDLSKRVGMGSYLEIERALVAGRPHKTGGGRWLDDDICDIQYSFLIARDRKRISDLVDRPTKPAMKEFPYLNAPVPGPTAELKAGS